jgi:glutathione peroxidase
MGLHDFKAKDIDGAERNLADFAGQAVLVVNVASKCGLTPQYEALQALHSELSGRGFAVLGFPCNQFGAQEPDDEGTIKAFCQNRYDVTFPMFAKVDVNGDSRHPLYAWLTSALTQPDGPGEIQWNFGKFVVDKQGEVIARFEPSTAPSDPAVRAAIERALG